MTADPSPPAPPDAGGRGGQRPLLRVGRVAWAAVGVLVLLVAAGMVVRQLSLVVIPLVLALFPAALLEPAARLLKRVGAPPALAALATIVGSLLILGAVIALIVPVVAAELPRLAESARAGVDNLLQAAPFEVGGVEDVLDSAGEQLGDAGNVAGTAVQTVTAVFQGVAGLLFGLVALFFYLKDGQRIAAGIGDLLPDRARVHAAAMSQRVWATLGRYFRGQLVVAATDAVLIGLGLLLLGIPLAVPLAVLIFFGALFPIVGAVVTGAVAVFTALADAGVARALVVLALILAVQQLEGNVLQPVVLGKAIALHPLLVLVAITAGAVTLGVLGAFLAVPVTASAARVVDYLRGRDGEDGEGGTGDEGDAPVTAMASSS